MSDLSAHALWAFCQRLVADGFIKQSRKHELLERAENRKRGFGFLTAAELEEERRRKTRTEELLS